MHRCAVVGCQNEGRSHMCPYDGRLHHHGRIHYDCLRAEPTGLVFHQDNWDFICDEHYDVLLRELLEREGQGALRA